eukprot:126807-Rhodomonas_salina.1
MRIGNSEAFIIVDKWGSGTQTSSPLVTLSLQHGVNRASRHPHLFLSLKAWFITVEASPCAAPMPPSL